MKKIIILIGIFTIIFNCKAQTYTNKELNYKPKNLEEAIFQLEINFPDTTKEKIKLMTETEFIANTKFTTGMWIRNEWLYDRYLFGLIVVKSELRDTLFKLGFFNNDDMSGVILRSFYRKLTGQEINLKEQIKENHQFYINMNNPEWVKEQTDKRWEEYMKTFEIGDTLIKKIYYNWNWLGSPKNNTNIEAIIIEKADRKLKIDIISFGSEIDTMLIYNELGNKPDSCWIVPNNLWRNKNE